MNYIPLPILGGDCSVCCSSPGEYRCSDCGVMVFCSRCNAFWHTENPHRTGHNVYKIKHAPQRIPNQACTPKEDISDYSKLNIESDETSHMESDETSHMESNEISHMESSNTSDYSLTDNDLDLKEIEEMCRVGTLAEIFIDFI